MTWKGKRILLGLAGGIAAYKAAELARLLGKAGCDVRVAMTEAATRFVTPVTMQALTGQTGWTDLWDPRGGVLEPAAVVAEVEAFFQPKTLAGKRVLVTAGPTEEPIDPVRMITNASSGKMGFAVARAAREAGAGGRARGP